jgi:hypothetical protein
MPARLTLFRLLIQERRWDNWSVFSGHFGQAARDLALKSGSRRLLGVSVARRTFDRWMIGELNGMPQPDTRAILEHLLGFPCVALFSPPPDAFSAATVEHDRGRCTGREAEAHNCSAPTGEPVRRSELTSDELG